MKFPDWIGLARKNDPQTSKEAAKQVQEFSANHKTRILDALNLLTEATAHEIAPHCGIDSVAVTRRLSELADDGLIYCPNQNGCDMTRKTPSGRYARVWRLM